MHASTYRGPALLSACLDVWMFGGVGVGERDGAIFWSAPYRRPCYGTVFFVEMPGASGLNGWLS